MYLCTLQSESASLKGQVKRLSEDNVTLKQALDGATAVIQRHKNDCEHSQVGCKIANWLMSEHHMDTNLLEVFHGFPKAPACRLCE